MKAERIKFTCRGATASPAPAVHTFIEEQTLLLFGNISQIVHGIDVTMEVELEESRWEELVKSGWLETND